MLIKIRKMKTIMRIISLFIAFQVSFISAAPAKSSVKTKKVVVKKKTITKKPAKINKVQGSGNVSGSGGSNVIILAPSMPSSAPSAQACNPSALFAKQAANGCPANQSACPTTCPSPIVLDKTITSCSKLNDISNKLQNTQSSLGQILSQLSTASANMQGYATQLSSSTQPAGYGINKRTRNYEQTSLNPNDGYLTLDQIFPSQFSGGTFNAFTLDSFVAFLKNPTGSYSTTQKNQIKSMIANVDEMHQILFDQSVKLNATFFASKVNDFNNAQISLMNTIKQQKIQNIYNKTDCAGNVLYDPTITDAPWSSPTIVNASMGAGLTDGIRYQTITNFNLINLSVLQNYLTICIPDAIAAIKDKVSALVNDVTNSNQDATCGSGAANAANQAYQSSQATTGEIIGIVMGVVSTGAMVGFMIWQHRSQLKAQEKAGTDAKTAQEKGLNAKIEKPGSLSGKAVTVKSGQKTIELKPAATTVNELSSLEKGVKLSKAPVTKDITLSDIHPETKLGDLKLKAGDKIGSYEVTSENLGKSLAELKFELPNFSEINLSTISPELTVGDLHPNFEVGKLGVGDFARTPIEFRAPIETPKVSFEFVP